MPVFALAVLLPLGACALDEKAPTGDPDDPADEDPGTDDGDDPDDPDQPTAFRNCTALPYTPGEPAGFEHFSNEVVAASGGPTHHAQDIVVLADDAATVSAVFQYSALAVDISDEMVRVSLDGYDGWRQLGEVKTDSDGRATATVDEALLPGVYHIVYEVEADATIASAYLWSLPAGTHLALFDIDGTLTTSNTELWTEILLGDYVPESYPDAQTLTTAHESKGYIPVYLAGRPGTLGAITRGWLDDQGYAHGIVHLADSSAQSLPTDTGVGAFKRDFMRSLMDAGLDIEVAYGNAPTDIFAYLSAGMPGEQVWIIGSHGGEEGTNPVEDAWTDRAAQVAAGPAIEQPFSR